MNREKLSEIASNKIEAYKKNNKIDGRSYNKLVTVAKNGRVDAVMKIVQNIDAVAMKGKVSYSNLIKQDKDIKLFVEKGKALASDVKKQIEDNKAVFSMVERQKETMRKVRAQQKEAIKTILPLLKSTSSDTNVKFGVTSSEFTLRSSSIIKKTGDLYKKSVIDSIGDEIKNIQKKNSLSNNDRLILTFTISGKNNENFYNKGQNTTMTIKDALSGGIIERLKHFLLVVLETYFENEPSFDDLKIIIQTVKIPRSGKYLNALHNSDVYKKKCIITLKNQNFLCTEISLAILEDISKENSNKNIIRREVMQNNKGKELSSNSGITKGDDEYRTIEDYDKLSAYLDREINIVSLQNNKEIIYTTKGEFLDENGKYKKIPFYLLKDINHVSPISNISALYDCRRYCHECKAHFQNNDVHTCKNESRCKMCKSLGCDFVFSKKTTWKNCKMCSRRFGSAKCFENHVLNKTCGNVKKCKDCGCIMRNKNHICYEIVCPHCNVSYNSKTDSHLCYIQKPEERKAPHLKYISFDFETNQETGKHIVNFASASYFDDNEFHDFMNLEDFCRWLFSEKHKGYTAIAHNGKGFDFQFLLRYAITNNIKPFCIYNGSKIMYMEVPDLKLRFVDSINFNSEALSKFPKTFGIKEMKKGYFPHFFNTSENQTYKGVYPAKKFYGYATMKEKDRADFIKWHDDKIISGEVFDFVTEMKAYCRSDVDILKQGMMRFRQSFLDLTENNVDPLQFVTIASVVSYIYRFSHMPEKKLAITEPVNKTIYSHKSIAWLNTFDNPNIKHGMNGGETKILINAKINNQEEFSTGNNSNMMSVDGYDESTRTVYEFYGCFYHGCQKCFKEKDFNKKLKKTMGQLYNETMRREEAIRKSPFGYEVITIWEHDFKGALTDEAKCLNPRHAMFGGRTETFVLKHDIRKTYEKTGEKICYVDITSLYPTVMYYDMFPVGHPVRVTKDFKDINDYFGFVKCKVKCPRDLYIPVLPVHDLETGKLVFGLGDNNNELTGTWATPEIHLAIKKGYKVMKIYEVLHFEERSDELFKSYIAKFLKIKQESSGYPDNVISEEQKLKYVNDYFQNMKIKLDMSKIELNAGMRAVSKLCLNSLWGKFAQRLNMNQRTFCFNVKDFYNIVFDKTLNVTSINIINDDCIELNYRKKDEVVEASANTNIYIGAFTTSNARVRLYNELDKVSDRVLYCDTDSIIYVSKPSMYDIPIGDNLGDWTSEFKQNEFGVYFLSTGPKSYYYSSNLGGEVCKIKGFTLHHHNVKKLNCNGLEKIIEGEVSEITVKNKMIRRDGKTKELKNVVLDKKFSMDFNKRHVVNSGFTLPYNHKDI